MEAAIIFPFTKETGISVTVVDSADMAKTKSQAASISVEWDLTDGTAPMSTSGFKRRML
jgi:putative spermidine/putrescine transport system substrate-binding protein